MINFGAKHCFIINGIIERLELEPPTVSQISIKMPHRNKIYNSHMLIREIGFLRGQKMVVNLIVKNMPNFDMILNMEFLSRYRIKINYKKKKV